MIYFIIEFCSFWVLIHAFGINSTDRHTGSGTQRYKYIPSRSCPARRHQACLLLHFNDCLAIHWVRKAPGNTRNHSTLPLLCRSSYSGGKSTEMSKRHIIIAPAKKEAWARHRDKDTEKRWFICSGPAWSAGREASSQRRSHFSILVVFFQLAREFSFDPQFPLSQSQLSPRLDTLRSWLLIRQAQAKA